MTWGAFCGALFFVYFLWKLSRWSGTPNPLKDSVRLNSRIYREDQWVLDATPLCEGDRAEGRDYVYRKLLRNTEEIIK